MVIIPDKWIKYFWFVEWILSTRDCEVWRQKVDWKLPSISHREKIWCPNSLVNTITVNSEFKMSKFYFIIRHWYVDITLHQDLQFFGWIILSYVRKYLLMWTRWNQRFLKSLDGILTNSTSKINDECKNNLSKTISNFTGISMLYEPSRTSVF